MSYIPVRNHNNLMRDSSTGAIINTDKSIFEDAKKLRNGSSTIKKLQSDVECLKNELSDIKNILTEFIKNASST